MIPDFNDSTFHGLNSFMKDLKTRKPESLQEAQPFL
jgi:hypothetical protein